LAISPLFLAKRGSPVLLSGARHEQLRQTSKFSSGDLTPATSPNQHTKIRSLCRKRGWPI